MRDRAITILLTEAILIRRVRDDIVIDAEVLLWTVARSGARREAEVVPARVGTLHAALDMEATVVDFVGSCPVDTKRARERSHLEGGKLDRLDRAIASALGAEVRTDHRNPRAAGKRVPRCDESGKVQVREARITNVGNHRHPASGLGVSLVPEALLTHLGVSRNAVVTDTDWWSTVDDRRHLAHTAHIRSKLQTGLTELRDCYEVDAWIGDVRRWQQVGHILVEVELPVARTRWDTLASACVDTRCADHRIRCCRQRCAGTLLVESIRDEVRRLVRRTEVCLVATDRVACQQSELHCERARKASTRWSVR